MLSTTDKYDLKLITQSGSVAQYIGVIMLPAGGYVASLNPGGLKFLSLLYNIYFFFLGFLFCFLFFYITFFSFACFPYCYC